MSLSDLLLKQESYVDRNENVSSGLYSGHQVKDELVLGPELMNPPNKTYRDHVALQQYQLVTCKKEFTEPKYVQYMLRDCVVRLERIPLSKEHASENDYNDYDFEEELENAIFDTDEQIEGKDIDFYFQQLLKPKPNMFKDYVRNKVCEICNLPAWSYVCDLVECKKCHGIFHIDCGRKEPEDIEVATHTRGRKKKRGCKRKDFFDLEIQFQDANCYNDPDNYIKTEPEYCTTVDDDIFETQFQQKIKDILVENIDYASDQEINWDMEPGDCEIVNLELKKSIDCSEYICKNCLKHDTPICVICGSNKSPTGTEERFKCQVPHCYGYYHLGCLGNWPQAHFILHELNVIELLCPRHVCHTCVSDPKYTCDDELVKCVKCPAAYHSDTNCLPAGSQILNGSYVICPRHYKLEHRQYKVARHLNALWCFVCGDAKPLVFCNSCPAAFHAKCLNNDPEDSYEYLCEDCKNGRVPLYGDIVWVKLGHYRWWPGLVLHPTEITDKIMALKHYPDDFVVRFFGQYNHNWVNMGRVFLFKEGNSARVSKQKTKIDAAFTTALEHAQIAYDILKNITSSPIYRRVTGSSPTTPDPPVDRAASTPDPPVDRPASTPDPPVVRPTSTPDPPVVRPASTPDPPVVCPTSTPDRPVDRPTSTPDRPPDVNARSTSRPPGVNARSTSRPPGLNARSTSRPPGVNARSTSRPPGLNARSTSRPPGVNARSTSRLPDVNA